MLRTCPSLPPQPWHFLRRLRIYSKCFTFESLASFSEGVTLSFRPQVACVFTGLSLFPCPPNLGSIGGLTAREVEVVDLGLSFLPSGDVNLSQPPGRQQRSLGSLMYSWTQSVRVGTDLFVSAGDEAVGAEQTVRGLEEVRGPVHAPLLGHRGLAHACTTSPRPPLSGFPSKLPSGLGPSSPLLSASFPIQPTLRLRFHYGHRFLDHLNRPLRL